MKLQQPVEERRIVEEEFLLDAASALLGNACCLTYRRSLAMRVPKRARAAQTGSWERGSGLPDRIQTHTTACYPWHVVSDK
jgi:hypothetical protein